MTHAGRPLLPWTVAVLLWVLLAAVVGSAAWTLLQACGLSLPGGQLLVQWCDAPPPRPSALDSARARAAALEDELRALRRQLAMAPNCPAPADHAACPDRAETGRILVVLDASFSMGFNFGLTPEEQDRHSIQDLLDQPGVDRFDVARLAISDLIRTAPDDLHIGLSHFNKCNRAPVMHGWYAPDQRAALGAALNSITLDNDTSLTRIVEALPGLAAGGDDAEPVTVLLFADGEDTCGGDPCASVRQVAADHPRLRINVITLGSGLEGFRCLSDATGGWFRSPQDADSMLQATLRGALGYDPDQPIPAHCPH